MKTKLLLIMSICILSVGTFFFTKEWDTDIYMESTPSPPDDKIDLKVIIDDIIVFNDTLQKNQLSFPTHVTHSMCMGFHTISISSVKANFQKKERLFLFFNQYISFIYFGISKEGQPIFDIAKGTNPFRIM